MNASTLRDFVLFVLGLPAVALVLTVLGEVSR